jgi:quinol monooxygenase YgiN
MKYGLFGKFVAEDGKRDELIAILLQAAELLRQNEECASYIVGKTDSPNDVWVSELWESKEAHDASLEPENIRELIMAARPLIAEMPNGIELQALGGKGF